MTLGRVRGTTAVGLAGVLIAGTVTAAVPAHAQAGPSSARNIRLCQGDEATPCETGHQANGGGDHHPVTVLVTDAAGAPVADVPVELREQGPGRFTTGGDTVLVTTGADGTARAVVTSDEVGTSYVSAEISPAGTPGSFRGPAAQDDECEQPAAPSGDPRAGNCTAGPLIVDWHVPPPPPQCSDGVDNDGDGATDYPADSSCFNEWHDSEMITDPPFESTRREVSLHFSEWRKDHVVVFGRVRRTGPGSPDCIGAAPVEILRRSRDGRWDGLAIASTGSEGWYVLTLPDRPGRYRAAALEFEPQEGSGVRCGRATKTKAHRHRG